MKFAVVKILGSQVLAEEGKVVQVDRMDQKEGTDVTFSDVLLYVDEEQATIGHPTVEGLSVTGKVQNHFKGDKLRVATFKSKSRYRKTKGFRHSFTNVVINSIATSKPKKA